MKFECELCVNTYTDTQNRRSFAACCNKEICCNCLRKATEEGEKRCPYCRTPLIVGFKKKLVPITSNRFTFLIISIFLPLALAVIIFQMIKQ